LTNNLPSGTRLSGAINGNLTGDVTVDELKRFDIGGQLQSSLTCRNVPNEANIFRVFLGSVSTTGEIKASAGDISLVQTTGNMLGDLRAPNGQIVTIDVGGNIGSSSRLSTITGRVAATEEAGWEAFSLIRAANIYANISATAPVSWLGRLETTGSPGKFVGSLSVDHINWKQSDPAPGIYLLGDLDADVTFGSGLSSPIEIGGNLAADRILDVSGSVTTIPETLVPNRYGHIYIKGSLLGDIEIGEGTAKGVRGFIEFNTNNASGVWTGDVKVRTPGGIETLSGVPAYSQLSSEITESGYYGAVGLVPFQLHEVDCTPPNGACLAIAETPDTDDEILMRHYGPVTWDNDDEEDPDPFVISFKGIGDENWHNVTDCFTQSLSLDRSVVVIQPTAKLRVGCEYRIELRKVSAVNVLRCDLSFPPSLPPVADHASPFIFTVGAASPGDANDDSVVNFDDINFVIANWLSTACFPFGDANHDGEVDFDDMNQVIANWLSEYDDCSSGMMMMAGFGEGCDRDMDDAIAAMGFENATEYAVFLAGLSNDERAMILAAVDEWLNCER
jgi:hypothetical protein